METNATDDDLGTITSKNSIRTIDKKTARRSQIAGIIIGSLTSLLFLYGLYEIFFDDRLLAGLFGFIEASLAPFGIPLLAYSLYLLSMKGESNKAFPFFVFMTIILGALFPLNIIMIALRTLLEGDIALFLQQFFVAVLMLIPAASAFLVLRWMVKRNDVRSKKERIGNRASDAEGSSSSLETADLRRSHDNKSRKRKVRIDFFVILPLIVAAITIITAYCVPWIEPSYLLIAEDADVHSNVKDLLDGLWGGDSFYQVSEIEASYGLFGIAELVDEIDTFQGLQDNWFLGTSENSISPDFFNVFESLDALLILVNIGSLIAIAGIVLNFVRSKKPSILVALGMLLILLGTLVCVFFPYNGVLAPSGYVFVVMAFAIAGIASNITAIVLARAHKTGGHDRSRPSRISIAAIILSACFMLLTVFEPWVVTGEMLVHGFDNVNSNLDSLVGVTGFGQKMGLPLFYESYTVWQLPQFAGHISQAGEFLGSFINALFDASVEGVLAEQADLMTIPFWIWIIGILAFLTGMILSFIGKKRLSILVPISTVVVLASAIVTIALPLDLLYSPSPWLIATIVFLSISTILGIIAFVFDKRKGSASIEHDDSSTSQFVDISNEMPMSQTS